MISIACHFIIGVVATMAMIGTLLFAIYCIISWFVYLFED